MKLLFVDKSELVLNENQIHMNNHKLCRYVASHMLTSNLKRDLDILDCRRKENEQH